MKFYWSHYLKDRQEELKDDPFVNILLQENHTIPTIIAAAQFDVLKAEAKQLSEKIDNDGKLLVYWEFEVFRSNIFNSFDRVVNMVVTPPSLLKRHKEGGKLLEIPLDLIFNCQNWKM